MGGGGLCEPGVVFTAAGLMPAALPPSPPPAMLTGSLAGLPVVIVGVTLATSSDRYVAEGHCWLNVQSEVIWAFVGPVLLVLAVRGKAPGGEGGKTASWKRRWAQEPWGSLCTLALRSCAQSGCSERGCCPPPPVGRIRDSPPPLPAALPDLWPCR